MKGVSLTRSDWSVALVKGKDPVDVVGVRAIIPRQEGLLVGGFVRIGICHVLRMQP